MFRICKTKPPTIISLKPKLQNQTCQTKATKPNLPNQTYGTEQANMDFFLLMSSIYDH